MLQVIDDLDKNFADNDKFPHKLKHGVSARIGRKSLPR